ncbi:MAG: hypothetical protein ACYCXW_18490 [Solirubrobacteraceae bacterium]
MNGHPTTSSSGRLAVAPNDRFHARGSFVDRLSSGLATAVSYVSIWGRLVDHGNAADVWKARTEPASSTG